MIYNLYIFDRKGSCLYYKEWTRPLNTLADDPDEEKRLMFGMLYSVNNLVTRMAPKGSSGEGLNFLRTNAYTLHHFETVSGLKFILNTDNSANANGRDVRLTLRHIYSNIWVEWVVKNPSYRPQTGGAKPTITQTFEQKLEEYVQTLPFK